MPRSAVLHRADPSPRAARTAVVTALREASPDGDRRLRFALSAAKMYVWERDMLTANVVRFGDPRDVLGSEMGSIEEFIAHVHPDERPTLRAAVDGAIARGEPYELEFRFRQPDGAYRWVRDIGRRVGTDDGDRFLGVSLDVTAEVEARHVALRLAYYDQLTGLANRAALLERLEQSLAAAVAGGPPVAALCIDLDGFKGVNDGWGHAAGDELLRSVADLLRGACRPGDLAARIGGDEFVLLLQPGSPDEVERAARELFTRAASPFRLKDGGDAFVGFSIGTAFGPADGADADTLLQRADIALYRAKENGRGELCFYAQGMDAAAQRRRRLERELRIALARDQLHLLYQPLIEVATGRMAGVEALLRWRHPDLGAVGPAEFIPLAETTGLIVPIGDWALRTACAAARDWPDLRLSVNVSAVQFRHPGFLATVASALAASGLEPGRLELEITESVLLSETDDALQTFGRLKALGVAIVMDDFGTGYSSLSYLSRFAFDKIKIDRSFTGSMSDCRESAAIVRSVLNLGHTLRMRTNAEGVEREDQLAWLRAEGCDEAQGYLFSPPVPPEAIAERLRAQG